MPQYVRRVLKHSLLKALPTLELVKGVEWAVQIDICELHFVGNVMTIIVVGELITIHTRACFGNFIHFLFSLINKKMS